MWFMWFMSLFIWWQQSHGGLTTKKFLQLNYDKREKLEDFADKIFPFFERMEYYDKRSLDFFNKEYEWVCKNWGDGTYWTMTLTEIIDSDKEFLKNNLKLSDKYFLKDHPHVWHFMMIWLYDDFYTTIIL